MLIDLPSMLRLTFLTGRLVLNLARTTPFVPCPRHTLPHTTRYLVPFLSVFA